MSDLSQHGETAARSFLPAGTLRLRKIAIAVMSLVTSVVLSIGKLVIGLLSGSLALVADALQGLVDIVITAVTVWVVAESDRGSDPRWTGGRHRIEALAALGEAALLTIIAVCIWYLALDKLVFGPGEITVEPWYIAAVLLAVAADWWRGLILRRTARETGSLALAANAAHFRTDALASLAVLAGLILAWLGMPVADVLATFAVAALLMLTAYRVGMRACDMLLERADPERATRLLAAVEADVSVAAVNTLRIAPMPLSWRIDLGVQARVDSLAELTRLEARLRTLVLVEMGPAEVLVAITPQEQTGESVGGASTS